MKFIRRILATAAIALGLSSNHVSAAQLIKDLSLQGTNVVLSGATFSVASGGSITATAIDTQAHVSTALDLLGSTRGSVLYRGASGWTILIPGTAGYVLATGGIGADPYWAAGGGGGGGTPGGGNGDIQYNNAGNFGGYAPASGFVTFMQTPTGANLASLLTTAFPYAKGGTGATNFTNHGVVTAGASALTTVAPGTSGNVLTSNGTDWASTAPAGGTGTVTTVGFTGGLISVANPTTTPALTVAGTSGGIPYFASSSTWASSAALAANALVIGGGAGSAPATTTTGTGVITALGVNIGSAGAVVTFNGAGGTPSSMTGTNITGTAAGLTAGSATTATTATNATNTAITDDTTTNATMYPTWVTANTGNLPQKVSSTKLSFNPSTSLLTTAGGITMSGTITGAATLTGTNTITTAAPNSMVLALGAGGTVLTLSSSPNLGTFAGKLAITGTLTGVTDESVSGIQTLGGTKITTENAMAALAIDVTKALNTKTVSTDSSFTFSGTPGTNRQWFGLLVTNSDSADHTLTIPSSFSVGRETTITSVTLPASGKLLLNWNYFSSAYDLYGDQPAAVGTVTTVGWTGGIVSVANPTTTPAFTIAGTSGGVPYFASSSTWASSGALTASQVVLGGGAGSAPTSLAAGSQYVPLTMGASNPGYTALALNQGAATSGQLLNTRGGTGQDSSGSTGVAQVSSGTWSFSTALANGTTATTQAAGTNDTTVATMAALQTAILQGVAKEAVKYSSTTALPTVVYANGSSGVGATLTGAALGALSLDSNTPSVADRVLIKNQVSTFQNGLYTVTAVGSGAAVFVMTRATDFNQSAEIKTGDSVFVTSGTVNGSTTWVVSSADSPVIGTDAITFSQTAGPGSITSGNGITVTGSSVAIDTSVTVDKTTAQTLSSKTLTSAVINGATSSGSTSIDLSGNSGLFKTTTGANTFGGSSNTFSAPILVSLSGTLGSTSTSTSTNKIENRLNKNSGTQQVWSQAVAGASNADGMADGTYYLYDVTNSTAGPSVAPSTGVMTAALGSSTATTQSVLNNSTKVATTAYADRAAIQGNATTALTESAGAVTIDWSLGNQFTLTLNANLATVTFSNVPTNKGWISVKITNTASNYTVTWGNSIEWPGGTQPVQTIGAHKDIWTIMNFSGTYDGSAVQNF